jgi:cell wall-associated NlpC family hydrolase
MSFAAAIGRIDQIMVLQQKLLDPGASAAGSTAAPGAALTTDTATGQSSDFASTLANAQATSASTPSGIVAGTSGGVSMGDPRVTAMTDAANALVGKPYVYGGGHSGWGPQSGYDCSGFVSAVLHAGGYLSSPQDTVSLPSQAGMEAGPGQSVTIYDRALPGQSGHVIIDINGQFYESGGSHGAWGGGGGVEKIGTPTAAYLATFPTVLHPSGL